MDFVVVKEPFFGIFRKREVWELWCVEEFRGAHNAASGSQRWLRVLDKDLAEMLNTLPTVSFCEATVALEEFVARVKQYPSAGDDLTEYLRDFCLEA